MSRDSATLLDIKQACECITNFIVDHDEPTFFDDAKTQSAVLHQLLLIGEAVSRLSDEIKAISDDVPWRQIKSMRNHLIHGYDAVDLKEVWRTAVKDVPELHAKINAICNRTG